MCWQSHMSCLETGNSILSFSKLVIGHDSLTRTRGCARSAVFPTSNLHTGLHLRQTLEAFLQIWRTCEPLSCGYRGGKVLFYLDVLWAIPKGGPRKVDTWDLPRPRAYYPLVENRHRDARLSYCQNSLTPRLTMDTAGPSADELTRRFIDSRAPRMHRSFEVESHFNPATSRYELKEVQ